MPEVEQLNSGSLDGPNAPRAGAGSANRYCHQFSAAAISYHHHLCADGGRSRGGIPSHGIAALHGFLRQCCSRRARRHLRMLFSSNTSTNEASWIESQIGVLRSQPVAAYVVKQLRLAEDPQFVKSQSGPFERLFDRVLARVGWGDPEPNSDAERFGAAVQALMSGLSVSRIGPSYLVQISFRSPNAEQATKIANAVIDGYIFDQLNAKYQQNRRAGDWLQERLQALREQAAAAERAVLEFKAKNNIVSAGGGQLMNEKQLSETSGQLAATRSRASDLQARLDRIQAVRKAYQQDQPPDIGRR